MKKAIVFDNSGTLVKRHRVIKDINNNKFITNINSMDIIDGTTSLALVVLQFDTNNLLKTVANSLSRTNGYAVPVGILDNEFATAAWSLYWKPPTASLFT